jgi:hypothetical protein
MQKIKLHHEVSQNYNKNKQNCSLRPLKIQMNNKQQCIQFPQQQVRPFASFKSPFFTALINGNKLDNKKKLSCPSHTEKYCKQFFMVSRPSEKNKKSKLKTQMNCSFLFVFISWLVIYHQ